MLPSARAPRPFHHGGVPACASTAAPEAKRETPGQFLGWFSDGLLLVDELLPPFPLPNEAAGAIKAGSPSFPTRGGRSRASAPLPSRADIFQSRPHRRSSLVLCAPLFTPQPPGMSAESRWQEHLWEIASRCSFARGQIHQRAPGQRQRGHGADSVPITHQRGSLSVYGLVGGQESWGESGFVGAFDG